MHHICVGSGGLYSLPPLRDPADGSWGRSLSTHVLGILCWGAREPHWLFKHLPEESPEFFCRSSCWQRCASGKDGKVRLWE